MPHSQDDELDDREWPEPDQDDNDSTDTVACPFCKSPVYDDAEWCPHCRNYLFYEATSQRPWWIVGGVVVCLAVVLYWIFH
jgi:uncharacterized protein YbaR (Trm112 family)